MIRHEKTHKGIHSAIDYYPFGMEMPKRALSPTAYRFGFNGKENDNEIAGTASWQNYGMREYDTRIARFISVDPLTKSYPWYTPYQFAGNKPIWAVDLDGEEEKIINIFYNDKKTVSKISIVSVSEVDGNSQNLNISDTKGHSYSSFKYLIVNKSTNDIYGSNTVDRIVEYIIGDSRFKIINRLIEGKIIDEKARFESKKLSGTFMVSSANLTNYSFLLHGDKGLDAEVNKRELEENINQSNTGLFYQIRNSIRKEEIKEKLSNVTNTDLDVDDCSDNTMEKVVKVKVEQENNPTKNQ